MAVRTDRRTTVRLVVGAVVVLVLIALIADNTKKVDVGYLVGDIEIAAWMLVVISAALGAVVAQLLSWARRH